MVIYSKKFIAAMLFVFLVFLPLVGCKPEGDRALDPKTGALVSPVQTPPPAAAVVSPIQTPLPLITPMPITPTRVPWPVTPESTALPTPGPLVGPELLYSPISHFSLTLSSGWYATIPDTRFASVIDIANYNFYIERRPPHGISIQIQAGPLPSDRSFEQWLADFRVRETSSENGAFGVTLTAPQPYQLGRYEGVTYVATGQEGESVLVLHILSGDGWIAVISLAPYDTSNSPAPAFTEALSMLSTIQISSQPLQ